MPYATNWLVYQTSTTYGVGLTFNSALIRHIIGTGAFASTAPAIAGSASFFVNISASQRLMIQTSTPGAMQGTFFTAVCINSVRSPATNSYHAGIVFLHDTSGGISVFSSPCYAFTIIDTTTSNSTLHLEKYDNGLVGARTTLASGTQSIPIGVPMTLRISWVASAGATQIRGGLTTEVVSTLASYTTISMTDTILVTEIGSNLTAAQQEGLWTTEDQGHLLCTFDMTALAV